MIAGYLKLSRQSLSDGGAILGGQVQAILLRELMRKLEEELVSGDGTKGSDVVDQANPGQYLPGIIGLLEQSGTTAIAKTAAPLDDLNKARTHLALQGITANVAVLNPDDISAIETAKATGSGEYFGNPFAPSNSVWNLPLVPAAGLPPGTSIVMDTSTAYSLLVREGATLRISDSDQDDFTRNRVTYLIETRQALAVYLPMAIAVIK